jgi:L-amino acid N-acyltransferase YncA
MAGPADGDALQALYAPYVSNSPVSFEIDPPGAAEMADRVNRTLPGYPFLVAAEAGRLVGYAYASSHRARAAYSWSVEVSVYIDGAWHRQGAGRRLYDALARLLALQGYRQAFAGITLPNHASVGLHEALGFRPIGVFHRVGWKLGAWHDVGWWQLEMGEGQVPPGGILRLDQLERSALDAALQ